MALYERLYNEKGELAVLYGYSWSTYDADMNDLKGEEAFRLACDKRVIEFWMSNKDGIDIANFVESIGYAWIIPDVDRLKLSWIPKRTSFCIQSYDGTETIKLLENLNMIKA